jgi:hypothetical protein
MLLVRQAILSPAGLRALVEQAISSPAGLCDRAVTGSANAATVETLSGGRWRATNDPVDDPNQRVHTFIATLGGLREPIHPLCEFVDAIRQDNLRRQELPMLIAKRKMILDQEFH